MELLLVFALGYMIGSIPFAYIIGKVFYNTDVSQKGSGNLGGSNTGRVLGGKAVAALYGYLFSLWIMGTHAPLVFFLPLCIFLMLLAVFKTVSLSSIVSSVAALIYVCFADSHISVICAVVAFAVLILLRHRGNIRRMIAGNERNIHWIK